MFFRGQPRSARLRSRHHSFPVLQKLRDRGTGHAAHGFELARALAVKHLAIFAQHRKRRNALVQRDIEATGYVAIFIEVSDVDVDQNVIGFKQRRFVSS